MLNDHKRKKIIRTLLSLECILFMIFFTQNVRPLHDVYSLITNYGYTPTTKLHA